MADSDETAVTHTERRHGDVTAVESYVMSPMTAVQAGRGCLEGADGLVCHCRQDGVEAGKDGA